MPFGFRRSLRIAGPLRLNLSKSGLGLSLGVPGLHIGRGPRGSYIRAGLPGTGIYYRKSLKGPKPVHTRAPSTRQIDSVWMQSVKALLSGDAQGCLRLLDQVKPGVGPAVHIEVGEDVVVTIMPDTCGIAVLRAEALDRLGRVADALRVVEEVGGDGGCHVANVVAVELREHLPESPGKA
jgi:hypothetical protein